MKFQTTIIKRWDGDTFRMTILPKVEYRSLSEAAYFCQAQAIVLCPYDSGRLRSSISVKFRGQKAILGIPPVSESQADDPLQDEPEENTAHVGTNVEYAAAQEFGTQYMAAQPYLRPAADLTEGKAISTISVGAEQEIEKYRGLK